MLVFSCALARIVQTVCLMRARKTKRTTPSMLSCALATANAALCLGAPDKAKDGGLLPGTKIEADDLAIRMMGAGFLGWAVAKAT